MRSAPRRYKILHPVGKGAFGTVYKAQMQGEGDFNKDVAIKLMNIDVDAPDEVAQRQRDEARLLGLIRHRAILQVDGLVRLNGTWAVVMEYIDGINLRELLRFGPVPPSCALQIVGEVAGALNIAWTAEGQSGQPLHIIHRDIKPPNIQLTSAGEVKLLDFGVARADFGTRESETVGVILGTLRYMAPERLDGIDGPEGDIYALGVVLVELLTRKPMVKTSSNPARHAATLEQALDRVREAIGDTHRDLLQLCEDCLAYDPNDRPTSKQLERRSWGLIQDYPLPRLREWAEGRVREAQLHVREKMGTDELSGETLMEQSQSMMLEIGSGRMSRSQGFDPAKGLIGFSLAGLAFLALLAVGLLAVIGYFVANLQPQKTIRPPQRPPLLEVQSEGNTYPVVYRERDGKIEQDAVPDAVPTSLPPRPERPQTAPKPATPKPATPKPAAPKPAAPKPAPAPKPEPIETMNSGLGTSSMGTVVVTGASSGVSLRGDKGTFEVPGSVPDGIYDVVFNGVETLKKVRVRRGGRLALHCDPGFGICTK